MIKATKVRIYPTPEQAEFLNRQFGAVRFAYNKALHIISSQYKRHGTQLNAKRDMKPLLAVAKKSRKYHCMSVSCGDNWVKIPKMEPIKARIHRKVEGQLKSITLSRTVIGEYYASLLHDDGIAASTLMQSLDESKVLALDIGLTHLAIDSSGKKTPNPRFLKKASANLRRKQKALSRCQKGSQGRASLARGALALREGSSH